MLRKPLPKQRNSTLIGAFANSDYVLLFAFVLFD